MPGQGRVLCIQGVEEGGLWFVLLVVVLGCLRMDAKSKTGRG